MGTTINETDNNNWYFLEARHEQAMVRGVEVPNSVVYDVDVDVDYNADAVIDVDVDISVANWQPKNCGRRDFSRRTLSPTVGEEARLNEKRKIKNKALKNSGYVARRPEVSKEILLSWQLSSFRWISFDFWLAAPSVVDFRSFTEKIKIC